MKWVIASSSVIMSFFGVPSFEGLFIEGHNAMPDKAQEIKENGIARAKDLAHTFKKFGKFIKRKAFAHSKGFFG